jgi:hypothetical protein
MHESDANRDEKDEGVRATTRAGELPPEATQARRLRAAAGAEASYILSMLGR